MTVFDAKTAFTKTTVAAKVANFFEMVSIFEFMRVEAEKFRKTVFGRVSGCGVGIAGNGSVTSVEY